MDNKENMKLEKGQAKWYIVTSINGNEDAVYKAIEDKVRAYELEEVVQEMRLLKTREITIEVFDSINNPPPKQMRNSKTITWETLPGNRYKKTRIREINRFPGYIYIKMIMMPDAWYIIRNTYGVTGFVGSSGKGAQPIPMSDIEVENLFDPSNNQDIIINKAEDFDTHVELTVDKNVESEKKIEFFASVDNDGFFDSTIQNTKTDNSNNKFENKIDSDDDDDEVFIDTTPVDYLENHNQILEEKNIDLSETKKEDNNEIFDFGYSTNKHDKFQIGNTVVIKNGAWKGSEGEIINIDLKNNTVTLSIEAFSRTNEVVLSIDEIEKE